MSRIIEPWRGKVLLQTTHGSKLYNLNHEASDDDIYIVTEHGPARQKMSTIDGVTTDIFIIGLDAFLEKVGKGTHQAIEALNSPVKEVAPEYASFFAGIRTYSTLIEETYDRTIRTLAKGDTFKKRRHACRLAVNLLELRKYGRFNPSLSDEQVKLVNELASNEDLISAIAEFMVITRVKVERQMIVLVDMDGVIADWSAEYNRLLDIEDPNKEIPRTPDQRTFDLFHERPQAHKDTILKVMNTPGFYRNLKPITGAFDALRRMVNAGHIVYLVSSPFPSNETCAGDKFSWVEEHLGHEWAKRLIITMDKTPVVGTILIDDKPEIKGAVTPSWEHVVFDQAWNRQVTDKLRMKSWADLPEVLGERNL